MADTPLQQMFARMDNALLEVHIAKGERDAARTEFSVVAAERDEARAQLRDLKNRLHRISASVAQDQLAVTMAHDPEGYRQGTLRNLARQLGEAILESPMCVFTERMMDGDDGVVKITQVDVTLFKPKKLGSQG